MKNKDSIDVSSPILTDEALERHAYESALSEITLKIRGTYTGRLIREKGVWNIVVVETDGNKAIPKGIPFNKEEVTDLEMIVPARRI